MKAIIYARVSSTTERQNTDRQVSDLTKYAIANGMDVVKVFTDKISGGKKNSERDVLNECFAYGKNNKIDIVLFSELSRLGRDLLEIQENVKRFADNGLNAFFQKENITLLDENGKVQPTTNILITCLGMVAEIERENIKYRLNSGRELAKEKGVKMGRKVGSMKTKETKENQYKEVIKCLRKGLSVAETLAVCKQKGVKCSTSTIKRIKNEFISKK